MPFFLMNFPPSKNARNQESKVGIPGGVVMVVLLTSDVVLGRTGGMYLSRF